MTLKKKALEWKKMAAEATSVGVSSYTNIDRVTKKISPKSVSIVAHFQALITAAEHQREIQANGACANYLVQTKFTFAEA